jgi:uncharacterized protein YbjT (DUF2867 family)
MLCPSRSSANRLSTCSARAALSRMKVIVTGATGMVGEGVLLECLENPAVERVLAVGRRSGGHTHPKLSELLVPDFRQLEGVESQLTGYDACFYCAGVSSVGLREPEYTAITYDTPLQFAQTLIRLNPGMVLVHVSGAHTDGSEQGKVMWARVKGKAENALAQLPFKAVYNFRPSLMKPTPGQRHIKSTYKALLVFYPLLNLVFPGLPLSAVGRAMINAVRYGASKTVLEAKDMRELAERGASAASSTGDVVA